MKRSVNSGSNRSKDKTGRSKRWTFTLNNPAPTADAVRETLKACVLEPAGRLRYVQTAIERAPTTGTLHLQGYMETGGKVSVSSFKIWGYPWDSMALFASDGDAKSNTCYTMKEDPSWEQWGTAMEPGKRNDLGGLRDALREGASVEEIAEVDFGAYLRYSKALDRWKANCISSLEYLRPQVIVRWGPPGSGKTRFVYDNHPLKDIWVWPGQDWFDGYCGHPVALFDDFDGSGLGYRMLLRICDRYPITLPVKGSFTPWRPKIIYFTSNRHPTEWYPTMKADYHALERRITEIIDVV